MSDFYYTYSRETYKTKAPFLHFKLNCIELHSDALLFSFFFFFYYSRPKHCISEEYKGKNCINLNESSHSQLIYISKCIWQTCFYYLSPRQGKKEKHAQTCRNGGWWKNVCGHTVYPPCSLASSPIPLPNANTTTYTYLHLHTNKLVSVFA